MNKKILYFVLIAAISVLPFIILNVSLLDIIFSVPSLFSFLFDNFFPPNWNALDGNFIIVRNTILFAIVGTCISALLAFFLGILISEYFNPFVPIRLLARFFVSFLRNVPIIIFASILVFIFGIGPLIGVIALVLGGVGFLARSYANNMDELAQSKLEALKSTGASYFQIIFHGLFPAFTPAWLNWTLFAFEINIRISAVLGMVGAGGLGLLIQANLDLRNFRRAMALIILLMAIVLIVEFFVNKLRERLEKGLPYVPIIAFIIVIFFISASALNLNFQTFIQRLSNAPRILAHFAIFDFSVAPELLAALFTSILLGLAGLVLGAVFSFILTFFAAKNTAPSLTIKFSKYELNLNFLPFLIKGAIALLRAIPSLVIILMIIASLGFGYIAAVLGIAFSSLGYLTKAFIASVEEQEEAKIEALKSTGASHIQVIYHGILPAVSSVFWRWISLRLEFNISDSISLGVVGAGGIGMLLARAIRQSNFSYIATGVFIIFIAMFILELIIDKLRN
ncbi:MAG: ABC transporter permease subunit [Defluviitaleaceae bacterium]|nr:ABC transporter permease subunit [Defluviitaleaceae bacterium]